MVRWADGKPVRLDTPYYGIVDITGQIGTKFVYQPAPERAP